MILRGQPKGAIFTKFSHMTAVRCVNQNKLVPPPSGGHGN